jgi:hypothetical protein
MPVNSCSRARSSVDRALASGARGRPFESARARWLFGLDWGARSHATANYCQLTDHDTPDADAQTSEDPGPLHYRTIDKDEAEDYEPLHDFSCGAQATCQGDDLRATNEVHQALDALYRGQADPQTVVLGEREDDGTLVTVCCVEDQPIKFPPRMVINIPLPQGKSMQFNPAGLPVLEGNGAYINAIGCREQYGGHGAGRAILQHTVDEIIPKLWAAGDRPYIHAKVLPGNGKSQRMFDAVGFLNLGRTWPAWETPAPKGFPCRRGPSRRHPGIPPEREVAVRIGPGALVDPIGKRLDELRREGPRLAGDGPAGGGLEALLGRSYVLRHLVPEIFRALDVPVSIQPAERAAYGKCVRGRRVESSNHFV